MSTYRSVNAVVQEVVDTVGGDWERYRHDAHRKPAKRDVVEIANELGVGLGYETPKQQIMDAIMIRVGRDHRTGAAYWDSADWERIHEVVV